MTTGREPTNQRDDAPLRIVGHRLHKVDEPTHAAAPVSAQVRAAARSPSRTQSLQRSAPERSSVLRQIVLVDREIDALRDIAVALRDEYDFHITISGTEALNLLRDGAIDTILVGQTLYSSTGLNVLAEARRQAPQTHRVLLANAVEAGAVERGSAAVAPFRVMQRPCTPDKLRELLEANADSDQEPMSEPIPQIMSAAPAPARLKIAEQSETHDPADFEHVILETAPEQPRRKSRANGKANDESADSLPVIVYTDNAEFYQTIALALQDRHDVRLCTQFERAAEFAEMGLCPLLITDHAGTQVELQRISIALRALDTSVLTIAAGTPEVGTALRKLLGTGALHSFLPKPVSPPLVRLAVESAKRQYLQTKALKQNEPELKTTSIGKQVKAKPAAAVPNFFPSYRNDYNIDDYDESPWRRAAPKIAIAAALILLAAGGGWYWWRQNHVAANSDIIANVVAKNLDLAQRAFGDGRYAEPSDDSALYYYNQVLKLAPQDPAASAGLERTLERVIEQAEKSLLDERLDAAADAIASVRTLQPKNKRLPFLENQLDKERRRLVAARDARNNAAAAAISVVAQASEVAAPISNESQRQLAINRWLATARQRLAQDRLLAPENDSAEFYLRQVERTDPENAIARQGLREIGSRLLISARDALTRQQLDQAKRRANDALRFGADSNTVDRLVADIEAAAGAMERGNVLRIALQRTRDNRLFEPERDSAKYYLGQLQRLDPTAVETEQATRALALKLIENSDQAIAQQQMNTALLLLNEVRRLGFNGEELAAADSRVRLARNPAPAAATTKNSVAAAPKVIKTVPARFPDDAMRANVQGWVDVGFRITAGGDVTDIAAVASNPPGQYASQFERAAVAAIRQYKFEARNIDDQQVAQRMVVRVQFKLQ